MYLYPELKKVNIFEGVIALSSFSLTLEMVISSSSGTSNNNNFDVLNEEKKNNNFKKIY